MRNRLSPPPCPCRKARLTRRRLIRTIRAIERVTEGSIEFMVPSRDRLIDEPDRPLFAYVRDCEIPADQDRLASDTAAGLRSLAATLLLGAEAIEAMQAEGGAA